MQLKAVNVGPAKKVAWRDGVSSAIHKGHVHGLVQVGFLGLEGDEQADLINHGGADKAVFVMPEENYARFRIQAPYGYLGENLTISGLDEKQVCLGERLLVGSVVLEVTQPRSPCWKLAEQVLETSDWSSAAEFLDAYSQSGHVGFYCRVLQEGLLKKGDEVKKKPFEPEDGITRPKLTIHDLFLAKHYHRSEADWALLKQAAAHPALSEAWRKAIAKLIQQAS
ncbi:MOSC domain-containing protein [Thiomicrorhabdus chilensis]|uniref:MOSC domain-containing protein n=1 Tax=Thiomicrorhabdus chilensis TaxID=63656 RepID=UPI00040C925F|nr:MOSC domain-containing protein [Thiomicrorhabdus chilensis]